MNSDILSAVAALSAVFISVVSMVFTVIFSMQQLKHNKNSVRPICSIQFNDYEDRISVMIANVGTGPLTIKEVVCDDTERKSPVLLSLMPNIGQYWTTYTEDITGWTIPVGGKLTLIEVTPENDNIKYQIRSALESITIHVNYTDIYGTAGLKESRSLEFFGRNLDTIRRGKAILKK